MKNNLFKLLFISTVFLLMGKATLAQWVNLNPVNSIGKGRPVTFVIGDTGYVGNGDPYNGNFNGYTPQSNTWYTEPSYPTAAGDKGFNFTIGDTAYAGDGADGGYLNGFAMYIPGGGWTVLSATPPGGARAFTCGFSIGHIGYFGTGYNGSTPLSDFYSYNPSTNSWTTLTSLPRPSFGGIAVSINGKGYMGLGYMDNTSNHVVYKDMYQYDPLTNQWDTMAPIPTALGEAEPAYFVQCNKLIVTLGQDMHGPGSGLGHSTIQTWMFDPSDGPKGTWYQLPDYPDYPSYSPGAFAIRDTGYVVGGADTTSGGGHPLLYKYIPNINPITVTPNTTTCSGVSVTLTADGGGAFKWSPSAGLSDTVTTATTATGGITSVTANPTVTTTYTVTEAVCGQTATIVVAVGGAGSLDVEPKSPSVCLGQVTALTVSGGSGQGTNLVWSPSTGLNRSTGDTVLVTVTGDIKYTVTSSGACPSSGTDSITATKAPALTFSPDSLHGCPGQMVDVAVSGGSGYSWSPLNAVNKLNAGADSAVVFLPPVTSSVLFTVTGTSTLGCPDTGFVTLQSGGIISGGLVTAVRDTICQGTSGSLTLAGNSSGTIQWQSSADDATFANVGDTLVKYKTSPLTQSMWYRAVVGTGNCSATSDTLNLYVPPSLVASFYSTQTSATSLTFNSDSSLGKIRSYHWDFGDGGTSSDSNSSHTYAVDSTYYVCLTLYDGSNCSYTFCRYSSVTDGVPTISAAGNWIIYPNPFSEQLSISAKQTNSQIQSIEMYDVLGQLVINKNLSGTTNASLQLDVSSLAKGMYYVMIRTADADYVQKVVKQ